MISTLSIVAIIAGIGVWLVVSSFTDRAVEPDLLDARLGGYETRPLSVEEIELQTSFMERVLRPLLRGISGRIARQQPAEKVRTLQVQLQLAGHPYGLDAGGFFLMQILAIPVGIGLGYVITGMLLHSDPPLLYLVPGGLGVMLYFLPKSTVKSRIKKRTREIELGLPDAIDLLTISVEAGVTFDQAISKVVEKYDNMLSQELGRLLTEIRLGRPRVEALEDMGRRNGVEALLNLCQAIIQAEQLGVGAASVLRIQSEEIRRKRRQKAEEKGSQAPLKMLFPMVGCIFPCLFIVLLGPAGLTLILGSK